MGNSTSFFTKIFGQEMGEFVQVIFGFFVIMIILIGFPIIITKIIPSESKEQKYDKVLKYSREITKNIYYELARYDSLTRDIENKIDIELDDEIKVINKKREILVQLQNDFDSIYLTPQQLRILATVLPENRNILFREWISSKNQLYNIGVSLFISFFFYYLGRKKGMKNIKT